MSIKAIPSQWKWSAWKDQLSFSKIVKVNRQNGYNGPHVFNFRKRANSQRSKINACSNIFSLVCPGLCLSCRHFSCVVRVGRTSEKWGSRLQLHTDFFFISGQKQRRREEKSEATKTASLQPLRKTRDEIMIDVVFAKEDKLKRSKEKSKALLTYKKNPYLLTKQKIRAAVERGKKVGWNTLKISCILFCKIQKSFYLA